ncbi:hypothetical protein PI124_g17373 [Phytophthora idaei]|nr:hypothetical protein PI124_g17373 [Phytophthora idaei]
MLPRMLPRTARVVAPIVFSLLLPSCQQAPPARPPLPRGFSATLRRLQALEVFIAWSVHQEENLPMF